MLVAPSRITHILLALATFTGTAAAGSGYTYKPPPPPPPRPAPVYRPAPTPTYRAPTNTYKPAPYKAPDRTYQRQQENRRTDYYRDTQNRTTRDSINKRQADQDRYKRDLDRRTYKK
jgi:hypothetical protein